MVKILLILGGALIMSPNSQATENLISIPGGSVEAIWLSPIKKNEKEIRVIPRVKVPAFSALAHAVTNKEFEEFLKKNVKWKKKNISSIFADSTYLTEFQSGSMKDNQPVTYVSWFAARAFCESLRMRLPTIEEWEYMAAASETSSDANRDPKFLQRILNWYGEPKGNGLKPVKSIYKNLYGLWDMHGLIWEWVDDFNSSFVTGESREDSNFNKDLFCGAGSMSSADKENYAAYMRFAFRSALTGSSTIWNLGFRCVR